MIVPNSIAVPFGARLFILWPHYLPYERPRRLRAESIAGDLQGVIIVPRIYILDRGTPSLKSSSFLIGFHQRTQNRIQLVPQTYPS